MNKNINHNIKVRQVVFWMLTCIFGLQNMHVVGQEVCDCENNIFTAFAVAEPDTYNETDYSQIYILTFADGAVFGVGTTGSFPNLQPNTEYFIYAVNVLETDTINFVNDLAGSNISELEQETGTLANYCYELNEGRYTFNCVCDELATCPEIGMIETTNTVCTGNFIDITVAGITNALQSQNGATDFQILIGANSGPVDINPYETPPQIIFNFNDPLTVINGAVNLTAVGPLTTAGLFTIVAYLSPTPTDDEQCRPYANFEVTINEGPNEPEPNNPFVACEGEPVIFSAPPGYDYLWATDAVLQEVRVFNNTSLPVTITDENGCSQTLTFESQIVEAPNEETPLTISYCPDDFAPLFLVAYEGYTYLWEDGSTEQIIEADAPGVYVVTISNESGCSQDIFFEVNFGLNEPQPQAVSICAGETISLTAPDGYTYFWQNGSNEQSIEVSSPGNYVVTIIDSEGCDQELFFTVNEGGDLDEPNPLPIEICEGEEVMLQGPVGYMYLWSDGSTGPSITVSTSGMYTVEISDDSGCSQILNYIVNIIESPNQPQPEPIIACEGEVVNLQAPSGFSYLWEDGTQASNLNVTESGNYKVTITNGCEQVLAFEVIFQPLPSISFQTVDPTICGANNGMIQLTFTGIADGIYDLRYKGGFFNNIQVNNGSATINDLMPGIYNFIVIVDDNGCEAITDGLIEINESGQLLPPPSLSSSSIFCESNNVETIMAVGVPFANFTWYSDASLTQVLNNGAYYLANGTNETVYVTQTVVGSCESEALEVNLVFNPAVSLDSQSYEVCADEIGSDMATVDLTIYETEIGDTGGIWMDENGTIVEPANYQFSNQAILSYQINNENGCEATAAVKIKVNTVIPKTINNARCTFENGNLINLVAFAVINGLPENGTWSTNGVEIDEPELYILIEPIQIFKYDYVDDNGCPNQLTANITLEQAPVIQAKAVCNGTGNFDEYFIEVILTKNITYNDVLVTDGNTVEMTSGNGVVTFGPYPHSGEGLELTTIEAYFAGTTGCSMFVDVLETYCPQPAPCNCSNAPNAGTILAQSEPGSFNFVEYQQNYVLTDANGNIVQSNHTGLFSNLENNSYNVYAINADEVDAILLVPALSTATNISSFIPNRAYDGLCYTIEGPANYEVACNCFPITCAEIGNIHVSEKVCEGNTFDIAVGGIRNIFQTENNEADFDILFGYYNGIVALPDPYNNPPDGLFNGGNGLSPIGETVSLNGMGANLSDGLYTIVAYLSEAPAEANCRPMVRLFTEVYDAPELNPTANPICEGTTGTLTSAVSGGTFPYSIQWTDVNGTNYPTQNFTIHLATQAHAGTYQISVTDVNGCASSENVEVTVVENSTAPYVPVEVCEEIPGGAVEATVNLNEFEVLMSAPGGLWKDRSGSMVTDPENVFLAGSNPFRFDYSLPTQGNCEQSQVMIIEINSIELTQDIRSTVCRERAGSYDLTAFENQVDLSNGVWFDTNGMLVENITAVNLMDEQQFIYVVQDDNACNVPTDVSFNILEDVTLPPLESLVCNKRALAFDLTAFEMDSGFNNGVWQNINGDPIEQINSINLIEEDFQLIYSVQDEAGCYTNTPVVFAIKEDVVLEELEYIVCNARALAFDLTAFEMDIGFSNGVWQNINGEAIEQINSIDLVEEDFQLIYSVQDEDGCYSNTPVVFEIKEDVELEDVEFMVCSERALAFDLTVLEIEVGFSDGLWQNINGEIIEPVNSVNLIEEDFQLIYSVQDEDGCFANTKVIFTIKEDVNLEAIQVEVCNIRALSYNLVVLAEEANLSDGVWLNMQGNLITQPNNVNLTTAGLQLSYVVQNEEGCNTNTAVLFTIQDDVNLAGIEAAVCQQAALSLNLTSYENQIDQTNGIWLDQQGIPVDDATNVNLTEEGLEFTYTTQNEVGCFTNTPILFTINDDVQVNAVARCAGESNEDGFLIDVFEITGGDGSNVYQLLVGNMAFLYEGGTATFGPYQFSEGAIEIMAALENDATCNQEFSIAPVYCGDSPAYCDCTNLTNPVSIQVMAEPGSYNTNAYTNVYLLTISNGIVIEYNTTGLFNGLLRNTDYFVYAVNADDVDLMVLETALSEASITDVRQKNADFAGLCYELNSGVAQFNENCVCVDCEATAGIGLLLEDGISTICQGDSIGPFVATNAPAEAIYSYAWLVSSGAPDYIIDTLVEGSGPSYTGNFNLESEPGNYCVHGISVYGDYSLFEGFIFAQSITTGAELLTAIEAGQICADIIIDDCIPIEVNAIPEADIESSVNLCNTEGSIYPSSFNLNDLIIATTEGSTGNWYANFEDSIPVASTMISAIDSFPGTRTYYFEVIDGECESFRYVTKVNILDCTERICRYDLLSSEATCNTDGTFSLEVDILIDDPLSDEFIIVLNETEYGPFTDTNEIGMEQILVEGLEGEAGAAEILIKDGDSNAIFEPTPAFISEIHYENFGPGEGEAIEITALAGTDLANYSILLYNGNGGSIYNVLALGSIITDEGNGYGTYVLNFPLQNGPDGIALVDETDPANPVLLQFISYEGSFFAANGLAMGMRSEDIGVFEPGEVGESLQLTDFGWIGPTAHTFGIINNNLSLQLEPEQIDCSFNYPIDIPSCGACELNPTVTPVDCDLDASTYSLEIAMNATNPIGSQYTVNLAFSGFIVFNYGSFNYDDANAVIGPFQADEVTSYEFVIQDVDSEDCSTTVFFGPYNCLDEPVIAARDAGALPTEVQLICSEDEVEVKAIGAKVPQDTELCYVLHDGSDANIGHTIAFNNTGKFVNNGNLPLNVELCITAVLGNVTDNETMPTEIYDTSNCTPIVFLKPLQVNSSVLCDYNTSKYTVEYAFDGGLPAYNANVPYLVKNKASVLYGNTLTSNPIVSGKSYSISVSDEQGCSTYFRSEPVICEKLYVSLIAFDAKVAADDNIVDWVTEYEIDNSHFTLERSYNGVDYEAIAQKKGQGHSNKIHSYQHVDGQVQNGIIHYRLMQTAYDGSVNQVGYKVLSRAAKLIELDYLLPNPTTGQLYSGIMVQSTGRLLLEILEVTGRTLEQVELEVDKGLLELDLDVSTYSNGIYFIKIHYGDYSIHQKFIKQ